MGSLGRQGRVGDGMLACCSADGSLARHAAVPRVAQPAWRAWAMGHDPSGSGVDGLAYARRHVPCCANRPARDGLGEALLQWEPGLGGGEGRGGEGREATAGGQIEQRAWRRWWPSIMCSSQPAASQQCSGAAVQQQTRRLGCRVPQRRKARQRAVLVFVCVWPARPSCTLLTATQCVHRVWWCPGGGAQVVVALVVASHPLQASQSAALPIIPRWLQ